ncbi:MAG: hypothetical protein EOP83_07415 [Verrucomicrobiaceae bacterium]|nr:MAG: hypothetical protein EOP83_07415 [Verrucomicrobiaceae bacterium]
MLTLNAKGNAVLGTASLATNLSSFTNDAGFVAGTASVANSIQTLVKRGSSGGIEGATLTLLGVPGAALGSGSEHASIEIGRMDIASTPLIDFHSSGTGNDYDVRLIATGGQTTAALGSLNFYGASMNFNAPIFTGASQTTAANVNLYLSETTHATSKRASMRVGTGWEVGQDPSVLGIRDFYVYNTGLGAHAFIANTATNNVNFSNAVTVATSVYSGGVCGTARTAAKGNAQFTNGDSTHTGYIEFFPSGTGARHGWMGYSDGTTLNISAEVGYWNFIGNAPRIASNPIAAQNTNVTFGVMTASNLQIPAASLNGGKVNFDTSSTSMRIYESGTPYRGVYVDFTQCGAQSKLWHTGNINPLIDSRYAFAGDLSMATLYGNVGGAMYEPYAGAVVTGFAVSSAQAITQVRFRYIQHKDSNGNWYTLAYN